jgi:hypothetical protein
MMKGLMKKMAGTIARAVKEKESASAAEPARRKDNMAGMAIEAKKGGLIKKDKMKMVMKGGKKVPSFAADGVGKMKKGGMADKTGRAMTRKTADTKGRAMKGK